jgi:putative hemolysin
MSGLTWVLLAGCFFLSFVLSGMETGVFALSRLRIRQQIRAGRRSAEQLHHYLENPENFLWTILVGNTLANLVILGWAVVLLHERLGWHPVWFVLAYSCIVLLFYALFDLLPKMLFQLYPTRLCILLARPFRLVHLVLMPLVAIVESFSGALLRWRGGAVFTGRLFGNREELRLSVQESTQGFTSEERAMISRVLELQNLTVRQAMKPLEQAVTLGRHSPVSEALDACRKHAYTRLPVWEERDGARRIIGLISCDTLLYQAEVEPAKAIGEFVKPALYIEEDARLEIALRRMQRSGQRLAIVLGPDRRESGVLSLQDVLKKIFGDVSL